MKDYIFVSYSSKNSEVATYIRAFLNKRGYPTWMAPYDIPVSSCYAEEIEDAITDCKCFLLVLSGEAMDSIWVPKELDRALNHKCSVVPIKIDKSNLNKKFVFYLTDVQQIVLQAVTDAEMQKVFDQIQLIMKPQKKAVEPKPNEPKITASAVLNNDEPFDADNEQIEDHIKAIVSIFEALKCKAKLAGYYDGFNVIRYEFKSEDVGITRKLKAIKSELQNRFGLRFREFLAPIQGRDTIGVDIYKKERKELCLSDLQGAKELVDTKKMLPLAVGVNIYNDLVVEDIVNLSHVLIGGASGSGKTNFLKNILCNLMFNRLPSDVRFLIFDSKSDEFSGLAKSPYSLFDGVISSEQYQAALNWLYEEMTRRFEVLKKTNKTNICDYNITAEEINATKMSYIIVAVDEFEKCFWGEDFCELMLRIISKSRAVGIHFVISTQRTTIDNINALLKSNIPAKIAFRMANSAASYSFIDCGEASALLGNGELLFAKADYLKPLRLQSPLVDIETEKKLVEFACKNYAANFDDTLNAAVTTIKTVDEPVASDMQLLQNVIEYVVLLGKITISGLQSKFSLPYRRSKEVIDQLLMFGIIKQGDDLHNGYDLAYTHEEAESLRKGLKG